MKNMKKEKTKNNPNNKKTIIINDLLPLTYNL